MGTTDRTARTRQRLIDAALPLFEAEGYDNVTAARIAAAVGVTEMTFFRHFASKERVLVDDPYDPAMAEAVGRQDRGLPVVQRVIDGLAEAWAAVPEAEIEQVRRRIAIAAGSPRLRAAAVANLATTEQAIVTSLASGGVEESQARVATAAVLAGLTAALFHWAQHDDHSLADTVRTALDVLAGRS